MTLNNINVAANFILNSFTYGFQTTLLTEAFRLLSILMLRESKIFTQAANYSQATNQIFSIAR